MKPLLRNLDDRLNPIVVKELRQAVGGRFVAAVLILFLVIQLAVLALWLLAVQDAARDPDVGVGVFLTLQSILVATCLLFLPAYAGFRFNAERADNNADLLFVTTLRPRQIVAGKFLSALLIALLIHAACAPFLAVTFLLRGIDLPTIFGLLGAGFVIIAGWIMFGLFLGSLPANRVLKSMLGVGTLIGLVWSFGTFVAYSVQSVWGWAAGPGPWLAMLGVTAMFIGLLFVLTMAVVSPPAANRALPVRIYLTAAWLIGWGVAMVAADRYSDPAPIMVWVGLFVTVLCLALLASISERDEPGPRVRRAIPRNPIGRAAAFLFYSGSAGGTLWCAIMLAATLIGAGLYSPTGFVTTSVDDFLRALSQFTLYILAYCLTALLLRRTVLRPVIIPTNTFALALILLAVGSTVPFVLVLLKEGALYRTHDPRWLITVPFAVLDGRRTDAIWWLFPAIWAGGVALLQLPWLAARYAAFRPPAVPPPPIDAEPETPEPAPAIAEQDPV